MVVDIEAAFRVGNPAGSVVFAECALARTGSEFFCRFVCVNFEFNVAAVAVSGEGVRVIHKNYLAYIGYLIVLKFKNLSIGLSLPSRHSE